jgi:hypothetical protein
MTLHLTTRSYLALALCAWLVLATAPAPARAQATQSSENEAKASFEQGLTLASDERWAEAAAAFEHARTLVARPSILFNLASVRYRLGQLVESREVLKQYFKATRAGEANYEEALRLHAVLEQDIPLLTLVPTPDSAQVLVDGKPDTVTGAERTLPLDPGDHRLELHAPGYTAQTLELRLERAMRLRKEIQLQPAPPVAAAQVHLPEDSAQPNVVSTPNHDGRKIDDDKDKGGLLSSPVFWVAAVVVVAGGVATALLLANGGGNKLADATGGTTNIRLTAPGGK